MTKGKEKLAAPQKAIKFSSFDKQNKLLDGAIPTSVIPESENIKRLISAIAEKQLSLKEMMAAVGLKEGRICSYALS